MLLSKGHLAAASAFYETNRRTSAARNTLWAIALNPKCLLDRGAQSLVARLCLGQSGFRILLRLEHAIRHIALHRRLLD